MDEAVTLRDLPQAAVLACLLALAAVAGPAAAQALQDPTRPPAGAALAAGAGAAAPGGGPRLQTILFSREAGGRRLAVIDGETVRVGEQFHGASVARIGDDEVVLVRGAERQVLRLYPQEAGGMTPVNARAGAQARR